MVLSAPVGPESPSTTSRAVLSVRRTEQQWASTGRLAGQLALYRGRETQQGAVARRCVAHSAQPFPPTDLRCRCGRGCGRLAAFAGPAEWAVRQLLNQVASQYGVECGNRVGIMPFGADAATLAGGSPAGAPGLIIQYSQRGQRGKNGSAR